MTPHGDLTRRLVLLRHAKAERPAGHGDALRPLSLEGREQAARVGARLAAEELVPEVVLVSTAVRTRQTWELAAGAFATEPETRYLDELYAAGVQEILGALHDVDARVRSVLVVGHEPTVSETAYRLAGDGSDRTALDTVRLGVSTAACCVLAFDGPWDALGRGGARLERVITTPRRP